MLAAFSNHAFIGQGSAAPTTALQGSDVLVPRGVSDQFRSLLGKLHLHNSVSAPAPHGASSLRRPHDSMGALHDT